jgi:hypothetical protein
VRNEQKQKQGGPLSHDSPEIEVAHALGSHYNMGLTYVPPARDQRAGGLSARKNPGGPEALLANIYFIFPVTNP